MPISYQPGTEILFGSTGNAAQFQVKGWRDPEINHTWSIGPEAQLHIAMPPTKGLYLKIKLSAFVIDNRLPSQRVTLQINGTTCAQWTITAPVPQLKIVKIPDQIVTSDALILTFITPDATSPASLGINADPDCLGVCLTALNIFRQEDIDSISKETQTAIFHTMHEFQKFSVRQRALTERRATFEAFLSYSHRDEAQWEFAGYCEACQTKTLFLIKSPPADTLVQKFRENVFCPQCGLRNRQRQLVTILHNMLSSSTISPKIYLYEQTTKLFSYLQTKLNKAEIIGSEYLGNGFTSGTIINGIRHEDALSLSFADNSYDMIVAADVYEHVPDIALALREAHRILKVRGSLIFTVPFHYSNYTTRQRSQLTADGLVHHLPEQYHENPVDPKGSLVFYDFGWDLLDLCRQQGFKEIVARHDYGIRAGYLGNNPHFVFIATK